MSENVEEYLKKRLLIDDNQNINTKFDELLSCVQMLVRDKCKEQKICCADDFTFWWGSDPGPSPRWREYIINAKKPKI